MLGAAMNRKDVIVNIGSKIRQMRTERGMSQEALAEKSDLARVNISRIESGLQEAGIWKLAKIARALDSDLSELFRGVDVGMD